MIAGRPLLAGGLAAGSLAHLMTGLLFGIAATDVRTCVAAMVLPGLVALIACRAPARRATRLDPMTAVRCE